MDEARLRRKRVWKANELHASNFLDSADYSTHTTKILPAYRRRDTRQMTKEGRSKRLNRRKRAYSHDNRARTDSDVDPFRRSVRAVTAARLKSLTAWPYVKIYDDPK
ncbi:hypothetical protein EVAR_9045_1 [Eumeta japonica]|uniref:Uncharacterized protein n=1 Tax=Eumeta variegata TaxID=151549 RepID=A0A4C1TVX9_EUMVA|nr:hypothetical protein EVAR_9045_1 [Eumeta japonica]